MYNYTWAGTSVISVYMENLMLQKCLRMIKKNTGYAQGIRDL